jgi:AraC-like DNA-binding protein
VSLPLFFLAIDIATIVCNVLLSIRMLTVTPRLRTAQLIALIAFCSACDVFLGRYDYRYWIPAPYHFEVGGWEAFLDFARNLTPGLFMILCFELFGERRRFPRWLLALYALQMFLEVPVHWLIAPTWRYEYVATQVVPATLEAAFAFAALYWTVAEWQSDLIEIRRTIRAVALIIISLNIVVSSFLVRVLISPDIIANYYTHEAMIACGLVIAVAVLFALMNGDASLILNPGHVHEPALAAAPKAADAETMAALSRLANLLEVEHVYRRPSLTLKGLADLAGLPEYRLRRLIHEELGYQNFNAFLHDYRIQEACGQLRDPKMRRIPILTIALSVGYQSVNTFNRGFRDITNMTPSAYRALDDVPVPATPKKIAPETA